MGDVRPYLALGAGLRAAGFDVVLATHPEFEAFVRSYDLEFMPIRGNPRELVQSPEGQALLQSGTNILQFAQRMRAAAAADFETIADDCLAASENADALLVSFLTAGVATVIARARQRDKRPLKTILGYLQPLSPTGAFPTMTLPTLYFGGLINRASHQLTRQVFWQVFEPLLDKWSQDRLKIRPGKLNSFGWLEKRSLVLCGYSRFLVPRPADWPRNIHVTGPWLLPEGDDFTPPPGLTEFLEEGPKPVYVGFGSMASVNPAQVAEWVITALKANNLRGVVHQGWGGMTLGEHENVFAVDQISHSWLFPRMAAVVHHGGAGTTHAGLSAGVPSLGLPFFGDQAFWSQRVFGMGCGPRPVTQAKLTQTKLTDHLKSLTDTPRYAKRAEEFSVRMRSEGRVPEAVAQIKRFMG